MTEILIKSKVYGDVNVFIDDDDFYKVSKYKWCVSKIKDKLYVYANAQGLKNGNVSLHRLIMDVVNSDEIIDHKDHNTLNNQKSNLRKCTYGQNNRNKRPHKNSTSKFLGVRKIINRHSIRWQANIRINNIQVCIGRYNSEEEAARNYDIVSRENFGEFAYLNFPIND